MQMKIYCFNENSADAVSNYNEMGIANIDLTNICLDNFHEEDPNTINLQELLILLFYYSQRT